MTEAKKVVARRPVSAPRRRAAAPTDVAPKHPLSLSLGEKMQGDLERPGDVYLGIDQSYVGFAVTAFQPVTTAYMSWCLKLPGTGVARLDQADFLLYTILETLWKEQMPVKHVAMEGYAFGSQVANMAGELGATVKLFLYGHFAKDHPARFPMIVPPTSLKKYVSGKGNAKKNEILLAVYKQWGVEFKDDNMADAYGLARYAAGWAQHKYQHEALEKHSREGDV